MVLLLTLRVQDQYGPCSWGGSAPQRQPSRPQTRVTLGQGAREGRTRAGDAGHLGGQPAHLGLGLFVEAHAATFAFLIHPFGVVVQ